MTRLSCCVLLALLAPSVFAEHNGHPVTLWKAQGERNAVYLLGSIHLLRAKDYPLPTVFDSAFSDAEVLLMEIDMDDLDPLSSQSTVNSLGLIHGDSTLRDLMGEDYYRQASEAAVAAKIPLDMLSKTEPWFAAMTIEMMALNRIGFDPNLGIEMQMLMNANAEGKEIKGLETLEEQLGYLDGLSMQSQREMLLATLKESAELGEIMDEVILAWRHGDIEFLESELLESFAEQEELNRILVTDRNARWVDHIDTLLDDDDDYLIIVGALHLVGDKGVPKSLARRGIPIQQLSEPPTVR